MIEIPIYISIIDVLLTSVSLYFLYYFFKGSYSATIMKGLVLVVLIFIVSIQLRLQTLSWILSRFFSDFPVIIAILFHQEIRHFFSNMGRTHQSLHNSDKFSLELAHVLKTLSNSGIGALIVIEGQMRLNDIINSGVSLNARFSAELIHTIFSPNTPLHDGAVIIRDEHIVAARVFIPTTITHGFTGTRHSAGIFISTERDCISFMVSEETGAISYAQKGILTPIPDMLVEEVVNEVLA